MDGQTDSWMVGRTKRVEESQSRRKKSTIRYYTLTFEFFLPLLTYMPISERERMKGKIEGTFANLYHNHIFIQSNVHRNVLIPTYIALNDILYTSNESCTAEVEVDTQLIFCPIAFRSIRPASNRILPITDTHSMSLQPVFLSFLYWL